MPRTTLDLDVTVLRELREVSRRRGKSMGAVASEALARAFGAAEPERSAPRWRTHRGGAYRVDLLDEDALWEALDGE